MDPAINKSLIDLVLSQVNLLDEGIELFGQQDFQGCVDKLSIVIDTEPANWQARLYLALAQHQLGLTYLARQQFLLIQRACTDKEVRTRAEVALRAMNAL